MHQHEGSRAFHQKSRNGCVRCKQRRVKCSMQAPTYTNYRRQNEIYEYRSFKSSSTESLNHIGQVVPPNPTCQSSSRIEYKSQRLHIISTTAPSYNTYQLFSHEKALWAGALAEHMSSFPHLDHCLSSIRLLYDGSITTRNGSLALFSAYRHHLAASELFRRLTPAVSSTYWFAALMFGVSLLIFHFAVQQSCPEHTFSYLEIIYVLRMSMDLATSVAPFLRRSDLWPLIQQRAASSSRPLGPQIEATIVDLEAIVRFSPNTNSPELVYRHAFEAFRGWVFDCGSYPRTWRHYIRWPGNVPKEFLVLVSKDEDIALLILIYWCAVLHLGPRRWFLESWPRRTAMSAMSKLSGNGRKRGFGQQLYLATPFILWSTRSSREYYV
ncbi:hypothetical protein K458DRAFT_467974 [Lentithecium fluviatile CBS 122367]|uniref:Zn(2)-C6 fungal-type domain-containing protein n=1 Tax=Lentithecium fluviatile CBS 122367 TaxID=1168545 RepID=A0A6G1IF96_9PLEO|nr:hypothetical protein K458DRAFT_467974 [Lentithecium fluviatile CBS 122367]